MWLDVGFEIHSLSPLPHRQSSRHSMYYGIQLWSQQDKPSGQFQQQNWNGAQSELFMTKSTAINLAIFLEITFEQYHEEPLRLMEQFSEGQISFLLANQQPASQHWTVYWMV